MSHIARNETNNNLEQDGAIRYRNNSMKVN